MRLNIESAGDWEISAWKTEGDVGEESEGVSDLDSATSVMLLGKEVGRVSPRGFVQVKRTAALLFRSIHSGIGMLQ